jgi:L-alanine-DL-glutamate epimerase-like enolase superfamily enzyme
LVHAVFGGMVRNYCECYNTSEIIPGVRQGMSVKERAALTMAADYRAFRMGAADAPANGPFNIRERVNKLAEDCAQAREGVGKNGDWCVDFHQRFDLADAIRGCEMIREYAPLFVEDAVRAEAFNEDLPILRQKVSVPLAAGEEWGNRWDFNKLVERHDIDWMRATLPNVGGITEMLKIQAICETHFVAIVPHFTGPIATAALVHSLGTFPGPVLMEYNYGGRTIPHMPVGLDFKEGKLYPNDRPGLGVELDMKQLKQVAEYTQRITNRAQTYFRPDGSITNW